MSKSNNKKRFRALATDGDGTLTRGGHLGIKTREALFRLRNKGIKIILTTGETPQDLAKFPHLDLFDLVVGENGALLLEPSTGKEHLLAKPPPDKLVAALRGAKIRPLKFGRVIIGTTHVHKRVIEQALEGFDPAWQVIRNRQQLMVLPQGVDKASGLAAALRKLKLSCDEVVAVGDAENDVALFRACSCGVAVANAVSQLKKCAMFVTHRGVGAGIVELVDRYFENGSVPGRRTRR
jgi:hydroxymethylpyrimidine pyrophosphatase-like HAD family hydrolase